MTLLIMAAGLGSRYGGLKQIDGIGPNNEPLIEYAIYDAIKAGFTKVIFIIKKEHESLFETLLGSKIRGLIEVAYVYQDTSNVPAEFLPLIANRTKPLGTGHAILCAKEAIGTDLFAVINADDFYSRDAFTMLHHHFSKEESPCLVGYQLKNTTSENGTVSRGVCMIDENQNLRGIREYESIDHTFKHITTPVTQFQPDTIVSMNCWGFTPAIFSLFEKSFHNFLNSHREDLSKCEFYLTYPIDEFLKQNEVSVKVYATDAPWYGITYQKDKPNVVNAIHTMIKNNIYPERLWIS